MNVCICYREEQYSICPCWQKYQPILIIESHTMIKLILIVSLCLLPLALPKKVTKIVKLKDFNREGPFIFLTKMLMGSGNAQVDVSYFKGSQISSQSLYNDIAVAMVNQTLYPRFLTSQDCLLKQTRLHKKQKFNLKQQRHGMKHFKIYDLPSTQLWYFYIYSCRNNPSQLINNNQQIKFEFKVTTNGSHFQENDHLLLAYIVLFVIWVAMIIKFAIPIVNILSVKNPHAVKLIVYGGMVVLGTAYLYRLIHLVIFWGDGSGIHVFQIFYIVLKNLAEAVIATMLIAIAWGWTIVHLKPSQSYIIIGVVSCLINIVSLILSSLTEQHQQLHHIYDTVPGLIVLFLRAVVFVIFWLGIVNSTKMSSGKVKIFLRKFGWIGGIYLISWPLTVIIVQLCFPSEVHRIFITFIEELVHICACTILCHMISNHESAYRKVSLHEDDNPLGMADYKMR